MTCPKCSATLPEKARFCLECGQAVTPLADAYFWATYGGAELDLYFLQRGRRYGIEFKFSDAPGVTRSMRAAIETLKLERLWVIAPAKSRYELAPDIEVCPLTEWTPERLEERP